MLTGAALGALVGAALAAAVCALLPGPPPVPRARTPTSPLPLRRAVAAGVVGLAVGLATTWPMAGVLAAGAVLGLPVLLGGSRQAHDVIGRLEALAAWTEMLRDTMAGAAGLVQAIMASAEVAPAGLAVELDRLSGRLAGRVPLAKALRLLADELDDPAADAVVAALVLAAEARAGQLGEVLSELARATREEVAMRQRVEASRARAWSTTRTVAGVSIGFVVVAALGAHRFLQPYGTLPGQAVLLVVGAIFAAGLWLMASMVRPRRPERFLQGSRT
jgi:tight adherence protein B